MKKFTAIQILVVFFLVSCVIFTGCTEDSSSTTAAETAVTATTAAASALYQAGDIVKNPASSSSIAVLIIRYDAAADSYDRAYIYPNSDGSWGYRMDDKTLTVNRATLEKMYSQKIKNVAVSSIPVGAPATTVATVAATSTVGTTSTTTTTTTATLGLPPKVKSIDPDKGTAATTVTISELKGQYFVSPVNVSLKRGSETIIASGVSMDSLGVVSCKIAIPAGTTGGYWDVVVTNPDKQSGSYQNGFYVVASDVTATATTTTAPAVNTLVKITQLQDTLLVTTGLESSKEVTVLGTNLTAGSKMRLTKGSTTITSTAFTNPSSGSAKGIFLIPAGALGDFYVSILDSSDTVLATSTGTLKIQ